MSDCYSYLDDLPCGSIQSSPEYAYLGHFRSMEYLCKGHNDSSDEDDASNVDKVMEQYSAGRVPGTASAEPGGA